jgi:glutamate-1-semialdehyde 2,1-aminomutase
MTISAAASPTEPSNRAHLPAELVAEYRAERPLSSAMYERAVRSLPGAETRAVTHYWPFPTIISHGEGTTLIDLDGHEYVDIVNNYTSLVHGNAYPPIADAAAPTLRSGTVFPSLHESQVELADALIARVASVDLVRFTNSGSEASALALRLARRVTGRRELVVATGGYHGAVAPFTPGEPEVRLTPYNDVAALSETITDQTAAIFMEPFLGAGGVIEADPAYLRAVQERARKVGAVFVLDEIQSLRNGFHGVQGELGLTPDLTTFAKIIGGGLPIGAIGGRAELLEVTSPLVAGRLDHAGTFNGHVTAAVAGLVSLAHLNAEAITRLDRLSAELAARIEQAGSDAGAAVTVTRSGSILNVHPGSTPVTETGHAKRDATFRSALHLALLVEGVYTTPRGMINLSTVFTDADLERVVDGYTAALRRLAPHLGTLLDGDGAP